jgi:hypothetical protein
MTAPDSDPRDPDPLHVTLRVGPRRLAPGALEGWKSDALTLLFADAEACEGLAPGDEALLDVRSSRGATRLEVRGALTEVAPFGGGLRCKLAFTDPAGVSRQIAAAAGLFERRARPRFDAPRSSPGLARAAGDPAQQPLEVRLEQLGATARGQLLDVSSGGLGAVFDDGRNLPAVGSTVRVELDLPPAGTPLSVPCRATEVVRFEGRVRVGLAFAASAERDRSLLEERVLEYILVLQRDLFRRSAA